MQRLPDERQIRALCPAPPENNVLKFHTTLNMQLKLENAELILKSDRRLSVIFDQSKELSLENDKGLQIAVNRSSAANAVRFWAQNTFDPSEISLSSTAEFKHYPPTKPRAHLSAKLLAGPYKGSTGADCWYISLKSESDLHAVLDVYLK